MNYMTYIGCCLLFMSIGPLISASEYTLNPMYARTFGLLFGVTRREFTALSNSVTALGIRLNSYESLSSDLTRLRLDLNSLQRQVTALARNAPKCPSYAASKGGQVIGALCYTVTATMSKFAAAQASCASNGGILAEPSPISAYSQELYSRLKEKFPSQFRTIEASSPPQIWIGYLQANPTTTDTLKAISGSGIFVPVTAPTILSNAPFASAPANIFAAAIVSPTGATWFAANSVTASLPAYICQFPTV